MASGSQKAITLLLPPSVDPSLPCIFLRLTRLRPPSLPEGRTADMHREARKAADADDTSFHSSAAGNGGEDEKQEGRRGQPLRAWRARQSSEPA